MKNITVGVKCSPLDSSSSIRMTECSKCRISYEGEEVTPCPYCVILNEKEEDR